MSVVVRLSPSEAEGTSDATRIDWTFTKARHIVGAAARSMTLELANGPAGLEWSVVESTGKGGGLAAAARDLLERRPEIADGATSKRDIAGRVHLALVREGRCCDKTTDPDRFEKDYNRVRMAFSR